MWLVKDETAEVLLYIAVSNSQIDTNMRDLEWGPPKLG